MEPKVVDQAQRRPGRCLASGDTEGPFIDTGKWAREHDPYVYLSVRWVEEVARNELKMISREDHDYHVKELADQVKKLSEEIEALRRFERAATEFEDAAAAVSAGSS